MPENKLATTNSNLPAGISAEMAARLKEGTGQIENDYKFLPLIEIDNSTEKKEIDGNEEDILCQPRWKITKKVDGELVTTPYEKSFGGIVLVIKYRVQKKYEPADKQTLPFFYSHEFSPSVFQDGSQITINFEDKTTETFTYKEFKAKYAEKYVLIATVYIWHNNEIVRLKLKKSALSAFWDYLKAFKGKDSVSLHGTIFGARREKEPKPYNTAEFKVAEEMPAVDWNAVITAQDEINTAFNAKLQQILSTFGGEVVDEEDEEEIKVADVSFGN